MLLDSDLTRYISGCHCRNFFSGISKLMKKEYINHTHKSGLLIYSGQYQRVDMNRLLLAQLGQLKTGQDGEGL